MPAALTKLICWLFIHNTLVGQCPHPPLYRSAGCTHPLAHFFTGAQQAMLLLFPIYVIPNNKKVWAAGVRARARTHTHTEREREREGT